MYASKTKRARKARRKSAKKTGLIALAAAAMASPVATAPVAAQSPSSVLPQPSPTEQELIDERMGTTVPDAATIVTPSPGAAPMEIFTRGVKDKAETTPVTPSAVGAAQPTPKREQLQTIILKPQPAAPSTKDKALIFTGPSKPSR